MKYTITQNFYIDLSEFYKLGLTQLEIFNIIKTIDVFSEKLEPCLYSSTCCILEMKNVGGDEMARELFLKYIENKILEYRENL